MYIITFFSDIVGESIKKKKSNKKKLNNINIISSVKCQHTVDFYFL